MSLVWFKMRQRSVQLKFRKPGRGVGAEAGVWPRLRTEKNQELDSFLRGQGHFKI